MTRLLRVLVAVLGLVAGCGCSAAQDPGLAKSSQGGGLGTREAGRAFALISDSRFYSVDTGAGLIFKVRRANAEGSGKGLGDLVSLVYRGIEYQDSQKGSQINSGFARLYRNTSAVSVEAQQPDADHIKITVKAGALTHYYLARRGDANIYMATIFSSEPDVDGLVRFVTRIPVRRLPNGPTPADIRGNAGALEARDVFRLADGQTRSKHYSNRRLKDWSYFGATGDHVGIWFLRDNNEGNSGGPFYRALESQETDTDQELTYIVNYGEGQTEDFRTGVLNCYTLAFTDGAAPLAADTSWFEQMGLLGWVGAGSRGIVAGSGIAGRDSSHAYTVALANATAQYWTEAAASDGSFRFDRAIPGVYLLTVYKGELAVEQRSVTVIAGQVFAVPAITIEGDPSRARALWRIGDWDGSPQEFLNGDKLTTMHPSDVRMRSWVAGEQVIGSSTAADFPAYQWQGVNPTITVHFKLRAEEVRAATLRIGITSAYAGGRPQVKVNGWSAAVPAASVQPHTRTLTVGSYRGNNRLFQYPVPARALQAGDNVLTLSVASGSGGSAFLSPGIAYDAIDWVIQ